jgi:hypothetical protein
MVEEDARADRAGERQFPDRAAVNALAMRFHLDHHALVAGWAAWALEQTATWASPTDPGGWDRDAALRR